MRIFQLHIYTNYKLWKNGCKKIILKGTYLDLMELRINSDCVSIYDAGKTQVDANSLTCIGFYPTDDINRYKKYKLL